MFDLQICPVTAQDHGPLDHVLQLADVSGPMMFLQGAKECGRNSAGANAMFSGKTMHELFGEKVHVCDSVAQRRDRNRHYVQAEK